MCSGDDTIELAELKFDVAGHIIGSRIVSGAGFTHICKNTDLYDLVAKSELTPIPWFEWHKGHVARDL